MNDEPIKRRAFFGGIVAAVAALPFLGWLKPAPAVHYLPPLDPKRKAALLEEWGAFPRGYHRQMSYAGMTWHGIFIPQGATITSAIKTFTVLKDGRTGFRIGIEGTIE